MKTKLQELRKKAGFKSAASFADRLGIPKDTYTGYEQGKSRVSLALAWQVCDALTEELGRFVSLDELAGRDWPRPPTALAVDEGRLLDLYRHTDQRGRAAIMRTAEGEAGMEAQSPPGHGEGAVTESA